MNDNIPTPPSVNNPIPFKVPTVQGGARIVTRVVTRNNPYIRTAFFFWDVWNISRELEITNETVKQVKTNPAFTSVGIKCSPPGSFGGYYGGDYGSSGPPYLMTDVCLTSQALTGIQPQPLSVWKWVAAWARQPGSNPARYDRIQTWIKPYGNYGLPQSQHWYEVQKVPQRVWVPSPEVLPVVGPTPDIVPPPFHVVPMLGPSPYPQGRQVGPSPKPRPQYDHERKPPPQGTKERKSRVRSAAAAVLKASHAGGEWVDNVDALWNALPKEVQKKYGKNAPPQVKAKAVYENIDKLDMSDAVFELAWNHYSDKLIGMSSAQVDAWGKKHGITWGPEGQGNAGPMLGALKKQAKAAWDRGVDIFAG